MPKIVNIDQPFTELFKKADTNHFATWPNIPNKHPGRNTFLHFSSVFTYNYSLI